MASDATDYEGTGSLEELVNLKFLTVSVVRKCKAKHAGMVYLRNMTTVPISFCFTQSEEPTFEVMPLSGVIDPFDVHFVSVSALDPAALPEDRTVLDKLELNLKAAQVSLDSLLAREVASRKGRENIITKACERVQVSCVHPFVQQKGRRKAAGRPRPSSVSEIMNVSLSSKLKAFLSSSPGKDGQPVEGVEKIRTDAEYLKHQEVMFAEFQDIVNTNFSLPTKVRSERRKSKSRKNEDMHIDTEEEKQRLTSKPVQQDC